MGDTSELEGEEDSVDISDIPSTRSDPEGVIKGTSMFARGVGAVSRLAGGRGALLR